MLALRGGGGGLGRVCRDVMMDTNLTAILIERLMSQSAHPQVATWGLVLAALLTALPPTLAAIMAYNKAATAAQSSIANNVLAIDTNKINKAQVSDLKEIHDVVKTQKEATVKIAEDVKEELQSKAKEIKDAVETQKVETAKIAEHVKEELDLKSAVNDKKLHTIFKLVNSDMGAVLTRLAAVLSKVAESDPSEENRQSAMDAIAMLKIHNERQDKVDAKPETGFADKDNNK